MPRLFFARFSFGEVFSLCLPARALVRDVYLLPQVLKTCPSACQGGVAPGAYAALMRALEAARAELRNFLLEGRNGEPLQYVHIERLSLTIENLQAGSHNTMVNLGDIKDPDMRKKVSELIARAKEQP